MPNENREKVVEIFERAAELAPAERIASLAAVCPIAGWLIKTGNFGEVIKELEKSLPTPEKLPAASPNDEIVRFRIADVDEKW